MPDWDNIASKVGIGRKILGSLTDLYAKMPPKLQRLLAFLPIGRRLGAWNETGFPSTFRDE